ncbi:MAG: HAMP domain-containing histidine kinase [Planctomycetes bacterium]|nr:HAMP domain-containing histidine kinase [Planctomycetota bacterium]
MLANDHNTGKRIKERRSPNRTYFWFITLRWFIAAGICSTSLFAYLVLKVDLSIFTILIIALFILLFNCGCTFFKRYVNSYAKFANIQILVDLTALIFLVHYTGGIESPMMFCFVFHVVIAAILLSGVACYLQTTFALILMSGLSILEYAGIIPHIHVKKIFPNSNYDNGLYLLSMHFFFITSLYVSAYLAKMVTNQLRKREKEVTLLKNSCNIAYSQLKDVDTEKSEFTFKVTHELRAPLSAIQSLLKSIEEGYAGEISEKARDLIIRSERRTGFLLILVNDLLDLVTGKIGKVRKGEIKSVDINETVNSTLRLLEEKAKARDVLISISPMLGTATLNIVPDDLELILTNLVDNAIKYTKKDSTIKINSEFEDGVVKIEISDVGIGINKDDISKIFDEFYRAPNAKDIEVNGTGLGLSIVKNLINRYGGEIDVRSKSGQGSTFTIMFPVKSALSD